MDSLKIARRSSTLMELIAKMKMN